MKKGLLGSTALVAASLVVGAGSAQAENEKINLGLGGYMEQWVGYTSQDDIPATADLNGFSTNSDTEVFFIGSTTLDNGITFGVNIQLEGNTGSDTIDESYMIIRGDFGEINIGSENSAQYKMGTSAPDVGIGMNSGDQTAWVSYAGIGGAAGFNRGPFGSTAVEAARANDINRITYYTPRFAGVQVGGSYAPQNAEDAFAPYDRNTTLHDGFSLGANYNGEFSGVSVVVAGGYGWWNAQDPTPAVAQTAANLAARNALAGLGLTAAQVTAVVPNNAAAATAPDDPTVWNAGARIGFMGVTVGGSYASAENDTGTGDAEGWDLGASYGMGPWAVSLTYYHGERDGAGTTLAATADNIAGSVSYAVGPGINFKATVASVQLDADTPAGTDNDAVIFVVGPAVSF